MVDLHMHSHYSDDGEFAPEELVTQCKEQGLSLISVTDHNCARANREAEEAARENGIAYIPGIEIDCVCENAGFHVLGYGIDYHSTDFLAVEKNVDKQGFRASMEMLEKTQELGFHVTENDMWKAAENHYKKDVWNGELFAEVLLAKPELADHPLLKPYRQGGSRSDNPYVNFYWDFYAPGKSCHAKMVYPAMQEILDIIHENHGIAVLAHPGMNLKGREHLMEEICKLPMDGIEAFSSYHTPEQAAYYSSLAEEHGLLITCGSDYHGKTKPSIPLGGAVFAPLMEPEQKAAKIAGRLLDLGLSSGSDAKK